MTQSWKLRKVKKKRKTWFPQIYLLLSCSFKNTRHESSLKWQVRRLVAVDFLVQKCIYFWLVLYPKFFVPFFKSSKYPTTTNNTSSFHSRRTASKISLHLYRECQISKLTNSVDFTTISTLNPLIFHCQSTFMNWCPIPMEDAFILCD